MKSAPPPQARRLRKPHRAKALSRRAERDADREAARAVAEALAQWLNPHPRRSP
jgi:DNA-binding SARP family transcriptional activator